MRCQTLVIGATLFAMGYARSAPDTLLYEKGELPAPEITMTYRPCAVSAWPAGTELAESLAASGAYTPSGGLDGLALATALSLYAVEAALPLQLLSRPLSVEKRENGYRVEFYTNEGIEAVTARRILDTDGSTLPHPPAITGKKRYLLAHSCREDRLEALRAAYPAGVCWTRGSACGEYHVGFSFDGACSLPEAASAMAEAWQRAFPKGEALITAMARDFAVTRAEAALAVDEGWRWVDGSAFADPMEAYAAGQAYDWSKGGSAHAVS